MPKLSAMLVVASLLGSSLARAEHAATVDEARDLALELTRSDRLAGSVTLPHVVDFEPGRVRVYSKGREKLQAIVASWSTHGWSTITVHGRASTLDLAQRRADKIRGYLIRYGVPADLVVAIGDASTDPIGTADLSIERPDLSASRRASAATRDPAGSGPPRSPTAR